MRSVGIGRILDCAVLAVLVAFGSACADPDPAAEVLKTRRLWKVDLSGFVQREDGAVSAQFRLSGPVDNRLRELTVRIELLDADGQVLSGSWESFDLRDVRRGGPVERFKTIPGPEGGQAVESVRLDPVLYPEPQDWAFIPELEGLTPAAE